MREVSQTGRTFGVADHGIAWAASHLGDAVLKDGVIRCGQTEIQLVDYPSAKNPDDFAVSIAAGRITVRCNTVVGTIAAILGLARRLQKGERASFAQSIRFRVRNYKHEMRIAQAGPRSITNYSDAMWEDMVRQIVSRQFNGLVLYPDDCHPFPHLLEFDEYPRATSRTLADRRANRAALNRMIRIAHQYGLAVYMQHYIGHFSREIAHDLGLEKVAGPLLSGVESPEINGYIRSCYSELFRDCPELDGLYFNFESSPNSYSHLLDTAIPVFNKLKRKPVMAMRLWNAQIEGVKSLVAAYKGRFIFSHKAMDTSDTYHYPSADSRVAEWKQAFPDVDFIFCIGPCHNCGTNLCEQLWADYEYVQRWMNDAYAKGADGIGFHSWHELLSHDVAGGRDVFLPREQHLSRFNILHLDAVVDFVNGRAMTRKQRVDRMAARLGMATAAAGQVVNLLEATSKIVVATYMQFYHSLAWEGFLTPGRNGHIQEPFFFYPSNSLNNTRKLNVFSAPMNSATWQAKTLPAKVAPDRLLQPIIDYVDPAKPNAELNPRMIAERLRKAVDTSFASLDKLRSLAGDAIADELLTDIKGNALLGEYTYREIQAAIAMYSMYFAKTKAAMVKMLRKGIEQLKYLPKLLAEADKPTFALFRRMLDWDKFAPQEDVDRAQALLKMLGQGEFRLEPFRDYVESHRQYNEIRRYVRAHRSQNQITMGYALRQIDKAMTAGRRSMAGLSRPADAAHAANVRNWLDFLAVEKAHMVPPATTCGRDPGPSLELFHDDCFRMGEHFLEDFSSFFAPVDYQRPCNTTVQFFRSPTELAVTFRESGIDLQKRLARWEEYRGSGSDWFITRVYVDPGKGPVRFFTILTKGERVVYRNGFIDARTEFSAEDNGWQLTTYLPFSYMGSKPSKGQTWRINVTVNPYIERNRCYTWSPQYDSAAGNPSLFGTMTFE